MRTQEKLDSGKIRSPQFIQIAQSLYDSYDRGRIYLTDLEYIEKPKSSVSEEWYGTLCRIHLECDKAIPGLELEISPLSRTQVVQLEELRKELKEMLVEMEDAYERNMIEAIKECENGYFLGSALISSRVIDYIFAQISGRGIKDKIETLKERRIVREKGGITAEFIMKADKKARNYLSHNLEAFPDCGEALEVLGICSRLLKLFKNYRERNIE